MGPQWQKPVSGPVVGRDPLRVLVGGGVGVRPPVVQVVDGVVGVVVVVGLVVVPVVVRLPSNVRVMGEGGGKPGRRDGHAGREGSQVVAGRPPGTG